MATRTQSSSGGSIAIQYEEFKPKSEFQEEEATNILLLHLPDFQKEKIKITYVHSSRVIRVAGEGGITNNTCSRFNEAFSVPENCDVQKIHARFQNGLLTITLPKITPTVPTNIIAQQAIDDENKKTSAEASKIEQKEDEPMKQKDTNEIKELREGDEKKTTTEEQQQQNTKKRKESLITEEINKKRKEEDEKQKQKISSKEKQANLKEDFIDEKVKGVKNVVAAAKKTVLKGFAMETSEERQSLVNMGVAVLVIAALGAYIYYRYGSSADGDSKD